MKKKKNQLFTWGLFLFMSLISLPALAQDKVFLRNGDSLSVKILSVGTEEIQFTYPGETVVNQKLKKEVKFIVFENGRKEVFNASVEIPTINPKNWKKEWESVVVTYNVDDVKGLTRVDNIQATSTWGGPLGGQSLGYQNCIKSLKKKAAKLGCGIILLTDSPNRYSGVSLVGTCYK